TSSVLRNVLVSSIAWPAISASLANRIAITVGGHHGVFPRAEECDLGSSALGNPHWAEARLCVLTLLSEAFQVNHLRAPQASADNDHKLAPDSPIVATSSPVKANNPLSIADRGLSRVEPTGIEPVTSALRTLRSPS